MKVASSICLALSLLVSSVASAVQFHSPKGFSVSYPSGWTVFNNSAQQEAAFRAASNKFGGMLNINADLTVLDPNDPGVLFSVMSVDMSLPITSAVPREYLDGFKGSMAKGHLSSNDLNCGLAHLGRNTVVRLTGLIVSEQGAKRSFQLHQYVVGGRGKVFIVTGIAPAYSTANAKFDKMIGQFKVD